MPNLLRGAWQWLAGGLVCALYIPLMLALLALTPGDKDRVAAALLRGWGRSLLWICGVKLVTDARATLLSPGKRVIVINHTSTLDLLVACALWPPRGSGVLKKEFRSLPVLGVAAAWLGMIFVDRQSPQRAITSLQQAAQRMQREDRAVWIAPEGTRSKTGELGRFKLGAWHMAAAAGAPLQPVAIHGGHDLWPTSQLWCRAGTVTIRALSPLRPQRDAPEAFRASADRLAEQYRRELTTMAEELGDATRS